MISNNGAKLMAPDKVHELLWIAATSHLLTDVLRNELVVIAQLMNWADIEAAIKEQ